MKRIAIAVLIALVVLAPAFGGVVKTQKSSLAFKSLGSYTTQTTDRLSSDRKLSETESEFKGKGLLGGLAGKTVFRSGRTGELIDLPALTIAQIDHKRKTYTIASIEKYVQDREAALSGAGEKPAEQERAESDIRIVKNEFKVTASGENKLLNGFDCRKFEVRWTVDWENVKTGEKGTDKLETDVWTTPETAALKSAQAEEAAFGKAYLKAMGLDADALQRDVLGTEWITIMTSLDPMSGGAQMKTDPGIMAREMGKIKGYPILIDGRYSPAPKSKSAETQEQGGGIGGIGGALGRLGKNVLKKTPDPAEANAPALAFTTEVVSIETTAVSPETLQVPADYKKK
ncbi:MAG: hypothetical protein PHI34_13770 [Acidobacteriota bacterium]|nr:hypothetical protein [Acidobacteriota bacterium]